jgi:hypothetical protein
MALRSNLILLGNMSQRGADRVGTLLAVALAIAVVVSAFALSWWLVFG